MFVTLVQKICKVKRLTDLFLSTVDAKRRGDLAGSNMNPQQRLVA